MIHVVNGLNPRLCKLVPIYYTNSRYSSVGEWIGWISTKNRPFHLAQTNTKECETGSETA